MTSPWAVRIETLGTRATTDDAVLSDCTDLSPQIDPSMERALAKFRALPLARVAAPRAPLPWWGQASISFAAALLAAGVAIAIAALLRPPAVIARPVVTLPNIQPLNQTAANAAPLSSDDAIGQSYDALNSAVTALLAERQKLGDQLAIATTRLQHAQADLDARHQHDATLATKAALLQQQLVAMRQRADDLEQLTQKLTLDQSAALAVPVAAPASPASHRRVMEASRDDLLDLLHVNFLQTTTIANGDIKTVTGMLAEQACTLSVELDSEHVYSAQLIAFLGRSAPQAVRDANLQLVDKVLRTALGSGVIPPGASTPPAVGEALAHPGKSYSLSAASSTDLSADAADISADAAGDVTVKLHPAR